MENLLQHTCMMWTCRCVAAENPHVPRELELFADSAFTLSRVSPWQKHLAILEANRQLGEALASTPGVIEAANDVRREAKKLERAPGDAHATAWVVNALRAALQALRAQVPRLCRVHFVDAVEEAEHRLALLDPRLTLDASVGHLRHTFVAIALALIIASEPPDA
jgi:hypothetical protein